jgi:hypothetical protein
MAELEPSKLSTRVRFSSPAPRQRASVVCSSPIFYAGIVQLVERNLAKVEVTSSSLVARSRFAGVAQLVERWPEEPRVTGSIPVPGARHWGCSSAGRATALQAEGRRFDPDHLHQFRPSEIAMKRKRMAPRNPFVAAAVLKKAGRHAISDRAKRRAEKLFLAGCSSKVEQSAFTRSARVRFPSPRPEDLRKRSHVFADVLKINSPVAHRW